MCVKNSLFKFFFVGVFFLCSVSCRTIGGGVDVFIPVDYSEKNQVMNEIDRIRAVSRDKPVEALWRSYLLKTRLPENTDASALFDELCGITIEAYKISMDEKDYFSAYKTFCSLETVGYEALSSTKSTRKELYSLAYGKVPGTEKKNGAAKSNVEEMIKGTVTVFVDKGIKITNGVGFADAVLGSGFFISKDGYIVTNHHVISDMVDRKYEGFSRLYVKLAEDPDTRIPAKVIGYDSVVDLALLKAEVDAPYVFELGSSKDLSVGHKVYAIGSPLGLEKTLTSGIISATDRLFSSAGSVFQIDAAVNSGNSGGPLIDEDGKVQAVVFAGVPYYQGLNFAIPVEYLKNELPYLFEGGEREHPWISAFGKTKKLPGSGKKSEGVTVNYVLPGGSADRAGLSVGDVIVSVDGNEIHSVDELQKEFMKLQSGTLASLGVVSGGETRKNLVVLLEKRPLSPGHEVFLRDIISESMYPILGMKLTSISTSRKKFIVREVMKNSPADEAGFSENDTVEVLKVDFSEKKESIYVQIYAKKRKNGFLDASLGLGAALDSPNYF